MLNQYQITGSYLGCGPWFLAIQVALFSGQGHHWLQWVFFTFPDAELLHPRCWQEKSSKLCTWGFSELRDFIELGT